MANNDDWVDLPVEHKAEADDWQDVSLGPDHEGEAQAGLEHFGNAAAMGYLPHLQALAEKPMTGALNLITGNDVQPDDYVKARDANIARMSQEGKDHPYASIAGSLAGAVTSAIPAGAGMMKIPGVAKLATMAAPEGAGLAARGAALAGRTAASAGAAGLQGALSNPGDTEGEIDVAQPEQRAKQGILNAALAAPLHLTGEGISSVGSYIGDRLKDRANNLAFRALGPFKRQVNQNRDEIQDIGREALDSGIIGWKPGSAATLEERASDAASQTGKKLGDLTDELTKLQGNSPSGITRSEIADNLRDKLLVDNPQGIPGIDKKNQVFEDMISEFEKSGKKPDMDFSDLRQAKMNVQGTQGQDGLINWNRLKNADIPVDEQFHRALASELKSGEENAADAIEKANFGESSNQIRTLKDQYGRQTTAAQIAANKADSQRANHILGLKDAIYGGAGGTIGTLIGHQLDDHGSYEGAKAGAALGSALGTLGSKGARDYGPQLSAKTSDVISKVLERSPWLLEKLQNNPTLVPAVFNALREKEVTPTPSPEEVRKIIGHRIKQRGVANE